LKDIIKRGLIGLNIEVTNSKNRYDVGLKGKIIDETRFTLHIKTHDHKKKRLMKKNIVFVVNKKVKIHGEKIIGRMEDRIRKKV